MPVTSQLLRGLPRAKVFASSLLPCQHHQSQVGPIAHRPASRQPSHMLQRCQPSKSYQTSSVLHSYNLTPPQVNSILKANEYSFKVGVVVHIENKSVSLFVLFFFILPIIVLGFQVPEFDGKNVSSVMGFESNQLPANAPIEDRRSAATCLQSWVCLMATLAAPVLR